MKIELRDLFNEFMQINGLSIAYASRQTGIPMTTLTTWARGERGISNQNKIKVLNFLNGDFLVTVQEVRDYMEGKIK